MRAYCLVQSNGPFMAAGWAFAVMKGSGMAFHKLIYHATVEPVWQQNGGSLNPHGVDPSSTRFLSASLTPFPSPSPLLGDPQVFQRSVENIFLMLLGWGRGAGCHCGTHSHRGLFPPSVLSPSESRFSDPCRTACPVHI